MAEAERQELRPSLREEPAPGDGIVVVRGGPTSLAKPHFTVTLEGPGQAESLLAALGDAEPNPYHERRPGRR